MFPIEQHRCISRTVLLIIFLEITFIDKSTSNQGACEDTSERKISYFEGGIDELDRDAAWQLCNHQNSSLPVICNENDQLALANFLKTHIRISTTWTSGKKITFNNWTWIDGQTFENSGDITVRHPDNTHVMLHQGRLYYAGHPRTPINYLCQYSGSLCNHQKDIHVTNDRCLRPSDEDRTWYNARNQCLLSGGDLATLHSADLNIIRSSSNLNKAYSYWIGLRKYSWSWSGKRTEDPNEEIKYSNWSNDPHSLSGECISIEAWNNGWKAVGCTEKKKVVCQRISVLYETTSRRPTTRITTSRTTENTTQSQVLLQDSCAEYVSGTVSYATLTLVLVVGICLIVISNVIVAVLVRKQTEAHSSPRTGTQRNIGHQDLQRTQSQVNSDADTNYTQLQLQPEYEEVG